MITILLLAIHVILSLALILIVLLQTGKGSDLASACGGGGANAVFGGAGPASFLNKMTTAVAVLFMVTSISLAYIGTSESTVMPKQKPVPVSDVRDSEDLEDIVDDQDIVADDQDAVGEDGGELSETAPVADDAVLPGNDGASVEDASAEQPSDQMDEAAPIGETE